MSRFLFSLILIFSLLSGMIAVNALYVNATEPFLQSPVMLSIDFGIVFPGQSITESFTIDSEETGDYIITLLPSSEASCNDMRSLLTVLKDPAENDHDGQINGAPHYSGFGSFDSMNDTSDKWFVTFTAPDDVNTGIDYCCRISIEPISVPYPVPTADIILMPDGEGDYTLFDIPEDGSHWSMIADVGTHDGNMTYVDNISDNKIDLYTLEDSGLTANNTIYKVTIFVVIKGDGVDRTNGFFGIKTGSNVYWGTRKVDLQESYTYYSIAYAKNPSSNLEWKASDIDSLQVGFFVDDYPGSGLTATQIYVVVDVTP